MTILGELKFIKIFLDDILIYSKTASEHTEHVKKVLDTLFAAGATINKEKSKFFLDKVEYLGHVIDAEGISPAPRGLDALDKIQKP